MKNTKSFNCFLSHKKTDGKTITTFYGGVIDRLLKKYKYSGKVVPMDVVKNNINQDGVA